MFSAKWLVCVFSYNRAHLLRNLVESAGRFYPEFDIAIFDDGSDEPKTIKLLNELAQRGIKVMRGDEQGPGSKHGGLYGQMNKALKYALASAHDYAYFVQDDMQFLWRDEMLESKVSRAFGKKECLMCNSSFLQKILTEGIQQRLPRVEEGLFSFEGNGVADTGIISLGKAAAAGLHFPERSEGGNGRYWYNKGYRLYWLPAPHLAWVPWPTTFRNGRKEVRKAGVLKPLKQDSITKLTTNSSYAYLEDYTSAYRSMIKPYWYTANPGALNLLKIYIKYYIKRLTT